MSALLKDPILIRMGTGNPSAPGDCTSDGQLIPNFHGFRIKEFSNEEGKTLDDYGLNYNWHSV